MDLEWALTEDHREFTWTPPYHSGTQLGWGAQPSREGKSWVFSQGLALEATNPGPRGQEAPQPASLTLQRKEWKHGAEPARETPRVRPHAPPLCGHPNANRPLGLCCLLEETLRTIERSLFCLFREQATAQRRSGLQADGGVTSPPGPGPGFQSVYSPWVALARDDGQRGRSAGRPLSTKLSWHQPFGRAEQKSSLQDSESPKVPAPSSVG